MSRIKAFTPGDTTKNLVSDHAPRAGDGLTVISRTVARDIWDQLGQAGRSKIICDSVNLPSARIQAFITSSRIRGIQPKSDQRIVINLNLSMQRVFAENAYGLMKKKSVWKNIYVNEHITAFSAEYEERSNSIRISYSSGSSDVTDILLSEPGDGPETVLQIVGRKLDMHRLRYLAQSRILNPATLKLIEKLQR